MTDDINQLGVLYMARKRKVHGHRWVSSFTVALVEGETNAGIYATDPYQVCDLCGITREEYEARQKRGRTSLRAGKDGERAIAKAYGGQRVGQYGGAADVVVGELFSVQSKVGWFSNRYWDELAKLPRTGGRIPTLIVSDRPGPGRPTRRMVIRMMSDDIDLHGKP